MAEGTPRVAAVALTVAAVVLLGTGCGSDAKEREYPVPESLCGLDVDSELHEPLFAPGSQLREDSYNDLPLASADRCVIEVDGEEIIRSETAGWNSFERFMQGVGPDYDYDVADGTPVAGEFKAMVWPGFALARTACEPGEAIDGFMIGIEAEHPGDEEESMDALSELIQPLMRTAVAESICTPVA